MEFDFVVTLKLNMIERVFMKKKTASMRKSRVEPNRVSNVDQTIEMTKIA